MVPRGSERSGLIKIRTWTFEELTDLKPDYRQDWLSHPFLGFHCQLTFFFNTQISLGTDIQMRMKLQRTKTEFWVYQIPVELSACLNSVEYCSKEILNTKISTSSDNKDKWFRSQRECSIAFQLKMKENKISRSFDQIAVLFKENFQRQS